MARARRVMERTLVVPAAGRGSRLGAGLPKVLVSVAGASMLEHLVRIYGGVIHRWLLVVSPDALPAIDRHCREIDLQAELHVQARPTGMLDAILIPREEGFVPRGRVWITWCDQIGVDPRTVKGLSEADGAADPLIFPTVHRRDPYIHFVRGERGDIVGVMQRREGDAMPSTGESDMGLFSLSASCYREWLPRYAGRASVDPGTGERNFLPFIPWLSGRASVLTIPSHDPIEAVGVNTPEELVRLERHLAQTMDGGH